jgi:TolB-like protein/tetratricopeptide (TPR) repeat protein
MRTAKAIWILVLGAAAPLRAQCPDGTPPPCAAASVRAVSRSVTPPSAAERARRFLILPFRNVTRQQDQEWLVEGSTTMLSDALSRWQGITVVPDEKLYPALKRAGINPGGVADAPSVRRVAEETGGWTAVTGEVLATGGRLRITARAWDVPTNRQLVRAASEIPSGGDVREAFDSVSLRLLQSVGLDSVTTDLANTTTRDLDAYRSYLRGLAHMRRSEIKTALAAFEDAVRRDSSFALAWARLGDMVMAAEPMSILNPMSRASQYSARAVALSAKLPPRQRAVVVANNAQHRAQFTEARRTLTDLLKQDTTDVEALSSLAALEMFDPILVSLPGGQRPRGNPNAAARLAKRVTQLDPTRTSMFGMLSSLYANAGVPGATPAVGVTREPSGFPDLMQQVQRRENLRVYYTVLRDSLMLVPAESLSMIPKDSLRGMRKQARAVARSWGERWLTAAPDQAAPHQLMSQLYAYDGEYASALRALAAAESLGVQTPAWSAAARRLVYQAQAGDLDAATRLADSLTSSGFFANPNNLLVSADAAMWAFALHLMRSRIASAATLLQQSVAMRRMMAPGGTPEFTGFLTLMGNQDPEDEPRISRDFRRRQLDSVLTHLDQVAANEQLAPWLPMMVNMFVEIVDPKKRIADVLRAADALAAKGQTALAFQLASNAVANDTTAEPAAAKFAWYRSGAEALNAVRLATQSRFRPGSATVSAERAVFEWRVDDAAPFTRNRAETPVSRAEYRWQITVDLGDRYYRLLASANGKTPGPPASGTLSDILAPSVGRTIFTGKLNVLGVMADTTALQGVALRTEIAPGVMRMSVTDPTLLATLRRERPTHARFRFDPCVTPVGTVGQRQCVDERIPISYQP